MLIIVYPNVFLSIKSFSIILSFQTMLECESWEIREVTSCTHHFLEVVELSGFTGRHNTVDLLLHLLEIAPSLKELIIDGRNPFSFEEETEGGSRYAHKLRAYVSENINLVVR